MQTVVMILLLSGLYLAYSGNGRSAPQTVNSGATVTETTSQTEDEYTIIWGQAVVTRTDAN